MKGLKRVWKADWVWKSSFVDWVNASGSGAELHKRSVRYACPANWVCVGRPGFGVGRRTPFWDRKGPEKGGRRVCSFIC